VHAGVDVLVLPGVEAAQRHVHRLRPHVELPPDYFISVVVFVAHDPDSLHVVVVHLHVVPPRRLVLFDLVLSDGRALLKKGL